MFETTSDLTLFDYFRIPYRRAEAVTKAGAEVERVTALGGSSSLFWPAEPWLSRIGAAPAPHFIGGVPVVGRMLGDEDVSALVERLAGSWSRSVPIHGEAGAAVSAIWRSEDGSSFLPFDPNEIVS